MEQSLQWIQQESVITTVISLIALLVAASALFRHLRMTFRALWKQAPPLVSGSVGVIVRTTLIERTISFAIVLGAAALLLVVMGSVVTVQWVTGLLDLTWAVPLVVAMLTAPFTFALLFKVLPPVRLRWKQVWLASVLCGVVWLIGAEALAVYGTYFSKNVGAYGAFGGVLVLMLWMKIMSQVLFLGAELCKVISSGPLEGDHRLRRHLVSQDPS
jgi:membrane protein